MLLFVFLIWCTAAIFKKELIGYKAEKSFMSPMAMRLVIVICYFVLKPK
jgi:hypothetical protein